MILLLSATPFEAEFLDRRARASFEFHGRPGLSGNGWTWLSVGVGKVNAAMTLAAFLEAANEPFQAVVAFGLGGAYPGSGLGLGELALAAEEIEADLGTARGMRPLGFPALELGEKRYYNRFPTDPALTRRLAERLGLLPLAFVTRDKVSETLEEAHAVRQTWGGAVENMEGAALARVALWRGLAFAELRGVSNTAGVRRKDAWRTEDALRALRDGILLGLEIG